MSPNFRWYQQYGDGDGEEDLEEARDDECDRDLYEP